MAKVIVLDSGVLVLLTNPNAKRAAQDCEAWFRIQVKQGALNVVPEVADYKARSSTRWLYAFHCAEAEGDCFMQNHVNPEDDQKQVIIALGWEGGGMTVFGRLIEDAWIFWSEGSSIDLDENDDEVWRGWKAEETSDLEQHLPYEWIMRYPHHIHPNFRQHFLAAYERRLESLEPALREIHERYGMSSGWQEVLQQC